MGTFIKTLLVIVFVGGVAYGGYWYYEEYYLPSQDKEPQELIEEMTEENVDERLARFPSDADLVAEIDLSETNRSIVNYNLIKERYPFLQELEDEFYEKEVTNGPVINSQLEEDLPYTYIDLWNSMDKRVFVMLDMNEDSEELNFLIEVGLQDNTVLHDLIVVSEYSAFVPVEGAENLFSISTDTSGLPKELFVKLDDDKISFSYNKDMYNGAHEDNLGTNTNFLKLWNEFDDESMARMYANGEAMMKLAEYSNTYDDFAYEELSEVMLETEIEDPLEAELPMDEATDETEVEAEDIDSVEETESLEETPPMPDKPYPVTPGEEFTTAEMEFLKNLYEGIDAIGFSMTIGIDELYIESYTLTHDTEMLAFSGFTNDEFEFVSSLPKDTLLFLGAQDPDEYIAQYAPLLSTIDPSIEEEFNALIEEVNNEYDIDILSTLSELFGGELVFAITESPNPIIPVNLTMMSELNSDDETLHADALKDIETIIESFVEDETYFPENTTSLAFVDDEAESFTFRKFMPDPRMQLGVFHTTELMENTWIVSSAENGLLEVFDTLASDEPNSLAHNERFMEFMDRQETSTSNQIMFWDAHATYQLIKPFLTLGLSDDEFEVFEKDVDPYLQKLHSLYSVSSIGENMTYQRAGMLFE